MPGRVWSGDHFFDPHSATLANPFPNGFQLPPGSSQGLSIFLGRAISFFTERPLNPYIQRWSLSVQQESPGRIVAEVSYVGSRGAKLGVQGNLNPIPRQYLSTKNERDQPVIDFLSAMAPNPFFSLPEFAGTGLASQNVARSQLLRLSFAKTSSAFSFNNLGKPEITC